MIDLPGTSKQWQQANNSDLFGNIHITKNINFDSDGYLRLSYSPRASMDDTVDADFDNPAVILYDTVLVGGYFIQTWDEPFGSAQEILASRPTQITGTDYPTGTLRADAIHFSGNLVVTQTTDFNYYVSGGWVDTNASLTNNGQHPLAVAYNRTALAVANVNTVLLYATPLSATPTLLETMTIASDFQITDICYFNQNIYIATQNIYGGHAYLYVWNAQGTAAQSAFEVDSNIIFSICVHKDSVVMLLGSGALVRFNGSGFTTLDAFPIFYTERTLTDTSNINLYKNILKSNGDVLYILFSDSNEEKMVNQPDGIWCYDDNVGLYHRQALSNSLVVIDDSVTTADVNTTTNQITTTASPITGTEFFYRNGGGANIEPLADETKYFVIKVDATHFQVALTKADAIAGTAVDLTSTGSAFGSITFFPNIDYGQTFLERVMSLCVIELPAQQSQYGIDIAWGAEVPSRISTTDRGTFGTISPAVESRGYFITPKIFSTAVTDNFNLVTLKVMPFLSELDKVIIKYRTYDDRLETIRTYSSTDWRATWTSSTTFTTTEINFANAVVGNEVEFMTGAAGGLLAHIESISENAGTYTVTIDETYDNYTAGDTSLVVFRNWIKWKTIEYNDSNANQYYISENIDGANGKFLQLKIELRGIDVRVEELLIDNVYRLPAKGK